MTRATADNQLSEVLTPERVDELRERVEKPARTPILARARRLGQRLWQRIEDLDSWMGGTAMSQQDRDRGELADSGARYTRHLVI